MRKTYLALQTLKSPVTSNQQYYYTKVQHHVWLATAANLIVSLILLAVELVLYFCIVEERDDYFSRAFDNVHWIFLVVFIVLNGLIQSLLVLGARKLHLLLLRLYLLFQGFLMLGVIFVIVFSFLHLSSVVLVSTRLVMFLFSLWSFIAGLRMLKITVHERSDE